MGFAGARYDIGFLITYGFVWIVFPNVSLSFTIFLCEVYGSRERDRPPLHLQLFGVYSKRHQIIVGA